VNIDKLSDSLATYSTLSRKAKKSFGAVLSGGSISQMKMFFLLLLFSHITTNLYADLSRLRR